MKWFLSRFLASIVVATVSTAATATTITLTGTIRDFNDTHPDMEGTISGVVTGLVGSTLTGKTPVYVGSGGGTVAAGGISSASSFGQWYTDVGGVNMAAPLAITLDNTITADPNVYTYSNNSFFPIQISCSGIRGEITIFISPMKSTARSPIKVARPSPLRATTIFGSISTTSWRWISAAFTAQPRDRSISTALD